MVFLPLHSCPQGGRVSPVCIGRFRLQRKRKKGRREREGKRERMEDMAFSEVLKQVHSDGIKIKKVDCTGNWSQ